MKNVLFILVAFFAATMSTYSGTITPHAAYGNSDDSCNLGAPSAFSASQPTEGITVLNWSEVSGAASYKIRVYELVGGSPGALVGSCQVSDPTTSLNYLESGKIYRINLSAICTDNTESTNIVILDVLGNM